MQSIFDVETGISYCFLVKLRNLLKKSWQKKLEWHGPCFSLPSPRIIIIRSSTKPHLMLAFWLFY